MVMGREGTAGVEIWTWREEVVCPLTLEALSAWTKVSGCESLMRLVLRQTKFDLAPELDLESQHVGMLTV